MEYRTGNQNNYFSAWDNRSFDSDYTPAWSQNTAEQTNNYYSCRSYTVPARTWYMRDSDWYHLASECVGAVRAVRLNRLISQPKFVCQLFRLLWKPKRGWLIVKKGISESLKKIQCLFFQEFSVHGRRKFVSELWLYFKVNISYLWSQILVRQVSQFSSTCVTRK